MSRRANGEGTVYQRKDRRWEAAAYIHTVTGRRKRLRVYAKTRLVAHERLQAKLDHARSGLPMPDRTWRIDAYLDYWLTLTQRTRRPTTHVQYESTVRNHLKPGLGHRPLAALGVAELQRFFDEQLDRGMSR